MILRFVCGGLLALTLDGPPELPPEPEPVVAPEPEPVVAPAPEPEVEPEVEPAPPEAVPAPEGEPIVVPAPEAVQSAAAGTGPVQPAHPPNPHARPSEGVYAVGSSGVAPLPPPPPPVPSSTISKGSWRGVGWLSARLHVAGPISGEVPARPTVIALGGGAEGGWRIRQWVALGSSFSRQPHEVYREQIPDAPLVTSRGFMTAWDVAFLRLYAPVRGRVDPFIDVGGGLSFFDPARDQPLVIGGTARVSAGLEFWITHSLTLGLVGIYRFNTVDDARGHVWQAAIDVGIHW
jgi:hypothetical protein